MGRIYLICRLHSQSEGCSTFKASINARKKGGIFHGQLYKRRFIFTLSRKSTARNNDDAHLYQLVVYDGQVSRGDDIIRNLARRVFFSLKISKKKMIHHLFNI